MSHASGTWTLPCGDTANSGRARIAGGLGGVPRERWHVMTGGDLQWLRALETIAGPRVVALAGTVLAAHHPDGRAAWALPRIPVTRVIAAGDLDGSGSATLLVRAGTRTLVLVDAADGSERWRWTTAAGTFVNDHGGVVLHRADTGPGRLVVAPTYADRIVAWDLSAGLPPRLAWEVTGPWDPGFGPSIVAADVGGGTRGLVLSSRLGSSARSTGGRVDHDRVVLGRRRGRLYQAVHDLTDGELREEAVFAPDRRGGTIARPYGLLTVAPLLPGSPPAILLASTQVEEYLAVTMRDRDGVLGRAWGRFIEKDWPEDLRELRVHHDALADLRGTGMRELVLSLWEDGRWLTRIVDPVAGWAVARAELAGWVAWGSLPDGSGGHDLILSRETGRATGGPTVVEIRSGADLALRERIAGASVLVAADPEMPPETAVMARRTGATVIPDAAGGASVVLRVDDAGAEPRMMRWSAREGSRHLVRGPATIASAGPEPGTVLIGRPDGRVVLCAREGGGRAPTWRTAGRTADVLVRAAGCGPELVVAEAGGTVRGGLPAAGDRWRAAWSRPGRLPAADGAGPAARLWLLEGDGPWTLAAWYGPDTEPAWRVALGSPLDHPVLPLPGGRIALTLRAGVHLLATEVRDAEDGRLLARFPFGAYLHPPALAESPDGPVLVLDDHGRLVAIDLDRAAVRWERDWVAAYGLPITGRFLRGGRVGIVRASGIHGAELGDLGGRTRWRRPRPQWMLAAGRAAIARVTGARDILVMPRRDGTIEALDVADATTRWSWSTGVAFDRIAVSAADLDGDGTDAVLAGLPDGRLVCLRDAAEEPEVRWMVDLGAGVGSAWASAPGGRPAIVVATSDGAVRLLR